MKYPIAPVPAPRMTRSDKWKKRPCVMRYFDFRDKVKEHNVSFDNGQSITFYMPMPKSWGKKKKTLMDGQPHQQKPDIDNLCKALLDSLFDDDSHIHHIGSLKKIWAYDGSIEIY
jgi:Holliday junction resolvase RusA-like endonuclease